MNLLRRKHILKKVGPDFLLIADHDLIEGVKTAQKRERESLILRNKTMALYDKNYYSLLGNEYRQCFRFQTAAFLRAVYIKFVFNPQRVLDVGCGMGNLVEMLRMLKVEALGIDISSYALSRVPKRIKRFFKKGSITSIPFADKEFEVVTTTSVFEHIQLKDVSLAMRECGRVAQKGMYHEIAVLEDKTIINKDPTHVSKFKASWWLNQFRNQLKEWEVKRGLKIPIFKNGVFLLKPRS